MKYVSSGLDGWMGGSVDADDDDGCSGFGRQWSTVTFIALRRDRKRNLLLRHRIWITIRSSRM